MSARHIKPRLMLKLGRESQPTLPELRESPPEEEVFMGRRQSLPLPAIRRSSIVYEENIPVVVRRRGVTMTVRIFGAEETEDIDNSSPGTETTPTNCIPANPLQLINYTRKPVTSLSVDSIMDSPTTGHRRQSLSSFGMMKGIQLVETPGDSNHLATPSSLSPCSPRSPDYSTLRTESPTHGIGLFKQVNLHFEYKLNMKSMHI